MATAAKTDMDDRPWYKEPWPWILMAGPFLAVVGCIITITLAFQNQDGVIRDGGVKQGLVVSKPAVVEVEQSDASTDS